jgi:hypothetical protein
MTVPTTVDFRDARARADRAAARSVELYELLERMRAAGTEVVARRRPPPPLPVSPPRGADGEDGQRRVAELEEMVAAAHDRAADLYETWQRRHIGESRDALEALARRHRELAQATRSIERLADRTLAGFEARVDASSTVRGKHRHLVALGALERLRVVISRRLEETVDACRRDGASWADIGSALHVTRQTAHERYRRRPVSASPDEAVH